MSDGVNTKIVGREELNKKISEHVASLTPPTALLDAIGLMMIRSIKKNFQEGGRPEKWKKSKRAESKGGKTLRATGMLQRSIIHEVEGSTVTIGTNVLYAPMMQFGGTIVPKTAKALHFVSGGKDFFAKSVTIPARPFMMIQQEDVARAEKLAARFVEREQTEGMRSW